MTIHHTILLSKKIFGRGVVVACSKCGVKITEYYFDDTEPMPYGVWCTKCEEARCGL
jgi:hypothetical protein